MVGVHGRGHAWEGGMCGGHMCGGGPVVGGMHGKGACMVVVVGVHATHAPPTLRDMVGQCAGGTHPTGMHSCYLIVLHESAIRVTVQFEHRNKSKKRSIQWSILFL